MAEEHRCQTQETHRLCVNNCGFFGSPTTLNLCSKCYRDHVLKEEQESSAKIAVENSFSSGPFAFCKSAIKVPVQTDNHRGPIAVATPADASSSSSSDLPNPEVSTQPNRCTTCRKRVGLTGFRCRCGTMFCSSHRYPEQHGCTFDFKAVGKEAIAKANPLVKGEKLQKI